MTKTLMLKTVRHLESSRKKMHYLRIAADTVDTKLAYQSVMANLELAEHCLLRCVDIIEKENLRTI